MKTMSRQAAAKAGWVRFQQFHQPSLADGDYEITVTQTVQIVGQPAIDAFTASKLFTVAGDRFELNPTDVETVFPPDGNLGKHANVLPHIIVNRSTLPWERTAEQYGEGEQEQVTGVPWLALLLFDEDQKPEPHTLKANELATALPAAKIPKVQLESWQHDDDPVTVIDVTQRTLVTIMPTVDELKLLAHVRFGTDDKGKVIGDELAVIIANRLPQAGKTSTAHLVSIEGRLAKGTVRSDPQKYGFDYQNAGDNDLIRLISLKSWSFACEDEKKGFRQLLLGLNTAPGSIGTLRLPRNADQTVERLFSKGYVVLPHYFRHGDQTASWFHGPLIPGKNTSPEIRLPARSADELVRYDPSLSMFDVSYAAAWELGRLLALQDKDFSTSLYQWKREHAQRRAQTLQKVSHLPFQNETDVSISEKVAAWFESLRQFEGVPFNYLVADERMLPPESIRFFRVDGAWVNCLADGAFSIGRVASSDHEADALHGEESPAAVSGPPQTGFLLRSEVVSGWPVLLVEGYADAKAQGPPLPTRRMDRLSDGVLLCLFDGEVARVEIHQKPETLHFGLDEHSTGKFSKNLRDANGKQSGKIEVEPHHWRTASPRTLNVTVFADAIKQKVSPTSDLSSAQFGLQMVEGVEKVIFLAGKPV